MHGVPWELLCSVCVYLLALLGKWFPLGLSAESADQVVHRACKRCSRSSWNLTPPCAPGEQPAYGYTHAPIHLLYFDTWISLSKPAYTWSRYRRACLIMTIRILVAKQLWEEILHDFCILQILHMFIAKKIISLTFNFVHGIYTISNIKRTFEFLVIGSIGYWHYQNELLHFLLLL